MKPFGIVGAVLLLTSLRMLSSSLLRRLCLLDIGFDLLSGDFGHCAWTRLFSLL